MSNPILSIIIPVYNTDIDNIKNSIGPLVHQYKEQIELIIVNDGSNERTTEFLLEYCEGFKNVVLISKKNEGVSVARNVGLEHSKGCWITFLDSDDGIHMGNLLESIEILDESIDFYFFRYSTEEKILRQERKKLTILKLNDLDLQYVEKNIYGYNRTDNNLFSNISFGSCWAKIYRKDFLTTNNIKFDMGITMGEDLCFILKILHKRPKCCILESVFYYYRIHNNSVCQNYNINVYKDYTNTLNYIYNSEIIEKMTKNDFNVISNTFFLTALNISIFNKSCKKSLMYKANYIKDKIQLFPFNESIKEFSKQDYTNGQKTLLFLLKRKLWIIIVILKNNQRRMKI